MGYEADSLFGGLLAIIPWFSFTSVFVLGGGFLYLIFKDFKKNKLQKSALILPVLISGLIYLKIYLLNHYNNEDYLFYFWEKCFITGNLKHSLLLLVKNVEYFFSPVKYLLFLFLFGICGIILLFKEKSKFIFISSISFFILILASFLRFYPFAERLILFMLPIAIILIAKPFDLISIKKKGLLIFLILIFLLTFSPLFKENYSLLQSEKIDKNENPREMLSQMVKQLKPNDVIYVNNSSDAEYAYYSSFYNIKNKVIQEKIDYKISKEDYLKKLNSLSSGDYWFFLPIDYIYTPVISWIEEWSEKQNVIHFYKFHEKYKSYLIYIHISKP